MNEKTTKDNLCHDFYADLAAISQGIIYLQQELKDLTSEQKTILRLMHEKMESTFLRWQQVKKMMPPA